MPGSSAPLNGSQEELYRGLPLKTPERSRVLSIQPGRFKAEVHLEMTVMSLADNPTYEALSYTWGGSRQGRKVRVNRHFELPVTDNLFDALRRLRKRFTRRVIWIDAICINQADLEERSSQVAMMGAIYKGAECVDVWLGEVKDPPPMRIDLGLILEHFAFPLDSSLLSVMKSTTSHFRNDVLAITSVFNSCDVRWYDRIWVVQEFFLAKKRYLCFGRRRIRFDGIRNQFLRVENQTLTGFDEDLDRFLEDTSILSSPFQAKSLLDWVSLTTSKQALDPRDQIYATLPLINKKERELIPVSYTHSVAQAFANASLACCVGAGFNSGLDILYYVTFRNQRTMGLPTWAVDFNSRIAYDPTYFSINWTIRDAPTRNEMDVAKMMDGMHLTLYGHCFDTVSATMTLPVQTWEESRNSPQTFPVLWKRPDQGALTSRAAQCECSTEKCTLSANALLQGTQTARELEEDGWSSGDTTQDGKYFAVANSVSRFFALWEADFLEGAGSVCKVTKGLYLPIEHFVEYVANAAHDASLFTTKEGLIGIAPMGIREGDEIIVADRGWPFLVLRREKPESYAFCGLAYVHLLTYSESWEEIPVDEVAWQPYILH